MVSIVLNLLRFRGRNQGDGGLGGEQEERKCLLQVQVDGSIVVVEVADGDVLADVQVEITATGGQYESAGNGGGPGGFFFNHAPAAVPHRGYLGARFCRGGGGGVCGAHPRGSACADSGRPAQALG